jgi:hypothetical protein
MWPFSRKKDQPKESYLEVGIKELKEFRDIGDSFKYLGRTMVVTRHHTFDGFDVWPKLICDYADNHGVLRQAVFGLHELEGLKKQNQS